MPDPPTSNSPAANDLLETAIRLATTLDEASLYRAAAYASMVADAIKLGAGDAVATASEDTDLELDFELDRKGNVWLIRPPGCQVLGCRSAVVAAMRRFLRSAT
jgi:hypothetical protein